MKFADDDWRSRRQKSGDVAEDFRWIVSVMQHHRDKRRVRLHTLRRQRGCVRSYAANLSYSALFLATLEVGQSFSRPVQCVDDPCRAYAIGEREANKAGPCAYLQHSV